MARKTALIQVWAGDKLVGLEWNISTPADSGIPTRFEEEVMRMFKENEGHKRHIKLLQGCDDTSTEVIGEMEEEIEQLQSENKRLKDVLEGLKVDIHYNYAVLNIDDQSEGEMIETITEALESEDK